SCHAPDASSHANGNAWSGTRRRRVTRGACRAAVRCGDREGDGEHGSEGNDRHGNSGSASGAGGAARREPTDRFAARSRNADTGGTPSVAAAPSVAVVPSVAAAPAGPVGRNGAAATL